MLDKLHLSIPFKAQHVVNKTVNQHDEPILWVDLTVLGVPLSGDIFYGEDGQVEVTRVSHKWESLESSYTPMAFKIFDQSTGKRAMPCIELKASPAKLLQGHNVFGTTSIRKGFALMMRWLSISYPKLYEALDIQSCVVYQLDCTYSARLPNEQTAKQVIKALQNTSAGQTKNRGDIYDTTVYWGAKNSRLKRVKAYLKSVEFNLQLEELRKKSLSSASAKRAYEVMSNPKLKKWAENLLRFEVTVMHRWLNRRGVSHNVYDLIHHQEDLEKEGRCFIAECWKECTAELFKAFEGQEMRVINDDKVLERLKAQHVRYNKKGQASYSYALNLFRTFRSLRDYGWDETMQSMSRPSFYRHISGITEIGIARATLQNLSAETQNNVVPLLRFVDIDFGAQRPDWYVEPSVWAA